jgi:RNA polymerase sigma-70 factor (ECF subfamily)
MQNYAEQIVAMRPHAGAHGTPAPAQRVAAEDAVSEAVLAALERPAAYAGQAAMRTWLVGILKHKIVDQIRRYTRECQVEPSDGDDRISAPCATRTLRAARRPRRTGAIRRKA